VIGHAAVDVGDENARGRSSFGVWGNANSIPKRNPD
jgi:hypothetical protein